MKDLEVAAAANAPLSEVITLVPAVLPCSSRPPIFTRFVAMALPDSRIRWVAGLGRSAHYL